VRSERTCAATTVSDFPRVAELACAVLHVAARHPVHLIRADAGLVLALEEPKVALAQQLEPALRDEPFLDDQEAVVPERLDLLEREFVDQERGRVLSGS
jgi:hypothetical protein